MFCLYDKAKLEKFNDIHRNYIFLENIIAAFKKVSLASFIHKLCEPLCNPLCDLVFNIFLPLRDTKYLTK